MTDQPNVELIAETWRKMMGDPANLPALLFGEVDDFLSSLITLVVAEDLNRHFSMSLVLEIGAFGKEPTAEKMMDLAEKMLRVSKVRERLNELAGTSDD